MERDLGPTLSGGSASPQWERSCGGLGSSTEEKVLSAAGPLAWPCQKLLGHGQVCWRAVLEKRAYPEPSHAKLTVGSILREVVKRPLTPAACREPVRGVRSPAERGGGAGAPPLCSRDGGV